MFIYSLALSKCRWIGLNKIYIFPFYFLVFFFFLLHNGGVVLKSIAGDMQNYINQDNDFIKGIQHLHKKIPASCWEINEGFVSYSTY